MATEIKLDEIIDAQCWSVICESYSHGDDSSIGWVVVGYFMSAPFERVIGRSDESGGSKAAVLDALKTIKYDSYAYQHEYIKVI